MVINPPNSIFKRIMAGTLKLRPADFLPRKKSNGERIGPRFPPGRLTVLRRKLLAVGVDPLSVGLPPEAPPNTNIFVPSQITYTDACREIKYDFVKQQVASMEKTVEEWRAERKKERDQQKAKKLPF